MKHRKPLRPNQQVVGPASEDPTSLYGRQWLPKLPKAKEESTIASWNTPGRGQQGESVSGGPNTKRTNIRKGPMR